MQFENAFEVPLPPQDAWQTLLDIRKVAPCVPGVELTEVVDDKTYKGKVSVRLGPVSLVFAVSVVFEEINEEKFLARASAKGSDTKGRGGLDAKIQFVLLPTAEGTRVTVDTVLNLSGSVAQYGRASGVIRGVAGQVTTEFANNLRAKINAEKSASSLPPMEAEPAATKSLEAEPAATKPLSAVTLLMNLLRSWLKGILGRSRGTTGSSQSPKCFWL